MKQKKLKQGLNLSSISLELESNGRVNSLNFHSNKGADKSSKSTKAREARRQLSEYLDGKRRIFKIKVAPRGTEFQRRVWAQLMKVPYGKTVSYQQLARAVGKPRAVRAVASACGANPIAIVIPCHRVVRSDGSLGGYFYGTKVKQALLDLESGRRT